jgi:peptidyl-prolyl cis-trans isomerase C
VLKKNLLSVCAVLALAFNVQAAEPLKAAATVNGVKIGAELLELLVSNNVAQGGKDTPELRAALKNELIAREVLAQEAKKQKLDQEASVKAQLTLQQSTLLADTLIAKQAPKFNLSEDKLRAEYKRQTELLADAEEYQLSHVVTATEAEAKAVIKAAKDGEAFDKLAREKSTSPTGQKGGSLGWLMGNQINPALFNVIANLTAGNVTALPISTPEGWQVIRLDAKRKFKAPSFEDSQQQLANAVFANERAEFVQKLVKAAKVEQ